MSVLRDAKISVKILALLLMLGAVTLAIAFEGSISLRASDVSYSTLVDVKLPDNTKIARARAAMVEMAYAAYRTVAHDGGSPEARSAAQAEAASYERARQLLDEVKAREPGLASKIDDLQQSTAHLHQTTAEAARLGLANQNDRATAMLSGVDREIDRLSADVKSMNDTRIAESAALSDKLSADAVSTSWRMLAFSVVGLLAGIGVSVWLARSFITGPIDRLCATMRDLAEGKTAATVAGTERRDEIGAMSKAVAVFRDALIAKEKADKLKAQSDAEQKLVVDSLSEGLDRLGRGDLTRDLDDGFPASYAGVKNSFNSALQSLRTLIGAVSSSAASIKTGSDEITHASEDLARRTEANAASLEETSAALTQIDGRLKASAVAAGKTVERADQAIATVSGGRQIAEEAVAAMGRVSESAKGIDSVIEGLDKIAFQTRVLAMNAAVEAGRAGEAGRGFAVVADLVGALAMRSEEEAKQAREQLTATQADIGTAVDAVEKVDGALVAISGDVGEVHQLLGTMAADNQAQSSAISQISVAIGTMDQSTQQNAAMVEQTSAAARSLTGEVAALTQQASAFDIGQRREAAAAPVVQPAPRSHPALAKPKPLPAAAVGKLVKTDEEAWQSF